MKKKKNILRIVFEALAVTLIYLAAQAFLQGCENLSVFHDKDKVYGSGHLESQEINTGEFSAINVMTFGDVVLTQADNYEIVVTADDNILDKVEVYVTNGVLVVDIDNDYSYQNCFYKVNVAMPHIERLMTSSAGSILGTNKIIEDRLSVTVNSAGNVDLDLSVENLQTVVRSAGNINLSGDAVTHRCELNSAGNLMAFSLQTSRTYIDVSSAGNGRVYVNDYLEATLSSAGSLYYKGNPQISYSVSSIGNLVDAN